jgi:hypothetical protein
MSWNLDLFHTKEHIRHDSFISLKTKILGFYLFENPSNHLFILPLKYSKIIKHGLKTYKMK